MIYSSTLENASYRTFLNLGLTLRWSTWNTLYFAATVQPGSCKGKAMDRSSVQLGPIRYPRQNRYLLLGAKVCGCRWLWAMGLCGLSSVVDYEVPMHK